MSIEKIEEFAESGEKHLNNLDVKQGFQQAEKPERQWFNYLLNDFSKKINQVIDGLSDIDFEFDGFAPKISELESNYTEISSELTRVSDDFKSADAVLQGQIDGIGGGKFAYTTYAKMEAAAALPDEDPLKLPANSSIDVTNDTDPLKNGTYSYDGTVFAKSIYDIEAIVRAKVLNTFKTKALMDASALPDGADAQVTDDTVNNGLYVKTAGAWVKSAYNPTEMSKNYTDKQLSFITIDEHPNYAYAFTDKFGDAAVFIRTDGTLEYIKSMVGDYSTGGGMGGDYDYLWQDSQGNTALGIKKNGQVLTDNLSARNIVDLEAINGVSFTDFGKNKVEPILGNYSAEINGVCSYGQSLSIGATSYPVVSNNQTHNNLMFNSGVRPQEVGTDPILRYATLVPLVEARGTGNLGETPLAGMTDMIVKLATTETAMSVNDLGYQMLASASGSDGSPISTLSKGSIYYNNVMSNIEYGKLRANQLGKTYEYQATTWMQGEADYSAATEKAVYKTLLTTLVSDIANDVKLKTGQVNDPKFISYQVASHLRYARSVGVPSALEARMAQVHLELSLELDDYVLACPMYQFDYSGNINQVHLTASDSRTVGAYFGIAYKKSVIDGVKFKPLMPVKISHMGKSVYIKLHVPRAPLAIDTDWVSENTDYGFRVFDGVGKLTITEVKLVQGDTIKITCAEQVPTSFTVDYALFSDDPVKETGRNFGARGNIRDSQGDDYTFNDYGTDRKLHNWLVLFTYTNGVSTWL